MHSHSSMKRLMDFLLRIESPFSVTTLSIASFSCSLSSLFFLFLPLQLPYHSTGYHYLLSYGELGTNQHDVNTIYFLELKMGPLSVNPQHSRLQCEVFEYRSTTKILSLDTSGKS